MCIHVFPMFKGEGKRKERKKKEKKNIVQRLEARYKSSAAATNFVRDIVEIASPVEIRRGYYQSPSKRRLRKT